MNKQVTAVRQIIAAFKEPHFKRLTEKEVNRFLNEMLQVEKEQRMNDYENGQLSAEYNPHVIGGISFIETPEGYILSTKHTEAMSREEKDEYPCGGCGEMVDVEDYCYNNGLCNDCAEIENGSDE